MKPEYSSYWQSTIADIPLSTALPPMVDVAVIGGGIAGASACYWLSKEGFSVALLERTSLAYGATGRNGGFVVAGPALPYQDAVAKVGHSTARTILQLTCENKILLHQVLEEEKIQCDYREPGALRLALTEEQLEDFKKEADALIVDDFPIDIIDQKQIATLIRTPIAADIIGGQFLPGQGLVHSAKLVQGLLRASLRNRRVQACHAELLKIVSCNDFIIMHTSLGQMQAKKVIVAINAWTSKLFPDFIDIILPIREQMLAYESTAPVFTPSISANVTNCEYWQQTPEGAILIGGCGAVAEQENIGTWDTQPTAVVQNAIEQLFPKLFPKLPPLHVTHRWGGLLDYTTDSLPIVDHVPSMPGVYVIAGFSGHGMPFGLRMGQLITAAIKSESTLPELEPYRLDRPTLKRWILEAP